VISMWTFRC